MSTTEILLFLAAVALSFFLSGMEAGVLALNRLRIRHWMRGGDLRAARLHGYLEKPEDFLWTILVGNTLANLAVVGIGVSWLHHGLRGRPLLLLACLAAGVVVFYAACELLPKTLFRLYPNRLCLRLATPFGLLHAVLRPLVALVALFARGLLRWSGGRSYSGHLFSGRDDLRGFMRESAHSLGREEQELIQRVLDLQHLTVRQVTTPFSRAVTVSADTPMREVLDLVRQRGHSRLPVWKEERGRRRITGFLPVRTLLYEGPIRGEQTAGELARPLLYLDEDARLETALRMMQRSGHQLAVVLGPDRQEAGIVSLQDILRVLFGQVNF
ncbi:MAG: hypothetical protein RJA22_635 [Verrucomicrobiota bacterium]|jgi:CBS domain containing-hemolysin-like protein